MSTNHNRIKVADLETNDPNKILKTNQNGELEFSDANNLQTENYNALDCTIEGKALDARQGKVLKEMIDNVNVSPPSLVNNLTTGGTNKALTAEMGKTLENTKLTASLASDTETQIISTVTEDKKVVTRSKLFNWWQWIKSQTQTISGMWNFTTKVTLASGTSTTPPLVIPKGTLTTIPLSGAIESDDSGIYYCLKGIRHNLITEYLINYYEGNSLPVYIWGNGSIGKQTTITNIVNNQKLFNNGNLQKDIYELSLLSVQSRWSSEVTNAKIELQINISNSSQPSTWYTISSFEESLANLPNGGIPFSVNHKSTISVQVLRDKYIYITGLKNSYSSESISRSRTENLKLANDDLSKQDMLVSFRLLTTLDINSTTIYQIFNTDYSLFQLVRK